MNNLTLFRISVFSTMSLLLAAIITPIATVAVDITRDANAMKYLEYVCVWCQYGSTDNNPDGNAMILNFTSIDFYFIWIPISILFLLSFIPIVKSFPDYKLNNKISDAFAINLLWVIAGISLLLRLSLTYLITLREAEIQSIFPNNLVIGELGWGSACLVIATITAASGAMFGFIEFQYELDEEASSKLDQQNQSIA